jgi:hypothetical protein
VETEDFFPEEKLGDILGKDLNENFKTLSIII